MFLVFCYLEEISKKNDFESSLDQRCMQCWRRKQPQQGAKPESRTEQKQPGETHIPHRAQRQHQHPKANSSHSPQPAQAGGNAGAPDTAPGTQGTAGAKLTCKAHTGRCVCMGHPGTGSHTELPCGSASPCSHSLQQAEPQGAAVKPWAHPGRANTRHSQALALMDPGALSPAHGERAQTPNPALAAPELPL